LADTAALVVALSAQLTKFERDMRQAGIMADKAVGDIEDKFSKMSPKISTSFFGNLFASLTDRALAAVTDSIKEMINRFQDLQKAAEYTGASMEWVYGLQEALKKSGVAAEEVNAAFKAVAFQLDEMKRGGDNALKTLLRAPGNQQFLKGFNAETATAEETMKRILTIIGEMPNPIRAVDVAKNLGIPATIAAAAFKEGGDAIFKAAEAAAAASPDLQKMANSAAMFDSYMRSAIEAIKAWITDNAWLGVKDTIREIVQLLQLFQRGAFKGGPLENFGADAAKSLDELQTKMNQFGPPAPPKRVEITGGTAEDPFARKTAAAAAANDFERATKSIEKHTASMQAEAATFKDSAFEQEEYRVQLLLTEALTNEGKEINEEYANTIATIAERAAKAKQALADVQFQMAKINQLGQTLGSALSTAFADAVLEGKKLNEVMSQLLKTLARAAINWAIMAPFTAGAGGSPSLFAGLFSGKAGGTDFAQGGMTLVGEQGPELVNLPRGSQVIPNHVLKSGTGSGGAIVYSPAIDARGASVEAVARLAQIMEADRASFAARTVQTIQQARRGRIPGL
jgi:hypothetical protein